MATSNLDKVLSSIKSNGMEVLEILDEKEFFKRKEFLEDADDDDDEEFSYVLIINRFNTDWMWQNLTPVMSVMFINKVNLVFVK